MIKFACPHCQQHFTTEESDCGNEIQCPVCQENFVIPRMATQAVEAAVVHQVPASPASSATAQESDFETRKIKPLIVAAWVMIGLTCLLSLVPALGFAAWLVAAPILFITLVAGIIVMTKGGVVHGILILLASLIGAPIFLFLAPILTTAAAAAGGTAAVGSAAGMQEAAQDPDSLTGPAREDGSSSGDKSGEIAGVGVPVRFKDSEWKVIEAKEMGSELHMEKGFLEESATTTGRYVYVRYQVTNLTNEEQMVLITPALIDSKGRRFEELGQSELFLPDGETGLTMEALPPSLPRTVGAIFEIPEDSQGLKFMCRNFEPTLLGKLETPVRIEPKAMEQAELTAPETVSIEDSAEELGKALGRALLESVTADEEGGDAGHPTKVSKERLAELKGELAEVDAKIESERRRWQQALDTINRLTNFKTKPVVEGSSEYHQCMAASKVIREVEDGAPDLKAKKAKLEAVLEELEK